MESENPQVTLLDILQNFKAYEGRKITTLGMVYRDDTVPPGISLCFDSSSSVAPRMPCRQALLFLAGKRIPLSRMPG
jgi:hypothetical protein